MESRAPVLPPEVAEPALALHMFSVKQFGAVVILGAALRWH